MTVKSDINVLVLPELFPKFDGDVTGVFIEDYLVAVSSLVNTETLYIRLSEKEKGIKEELYKGFLNLKRVVITDKKVNKYLKPFFYIVWFFKGYRLGKMYGNTNIIHAHGAMLNGLLAYFVSRKLKVPFIVSVHLGPYSRVLSSWFKSTLSRFVFNKASKVLVVSEHQKKEVLKLGISEDKLEVSFNPVNTEIFQQQNTNGSKKISFVSRLDEFKGGLRTLKAFHKLLTKHSDYQLCIVGEGEEYSAISSYIEKHNLRDKVTLKGTLSKQEIATVLSESSFFVFPSRHETFGLVAAEALCSGLPVIATNKTAPKEFVNDENGLLVNPDSIDEIANAMDKLVENRNDYDAEKIHNEIKARFGLEKFGDYLVSVYKQLALCVE